MGKGLRNIWVYMGYAYSMEFDFKEGRFLGVLKFPLPMFCQRSCVLPYGGKGLT